MYSLGRSARRNKRRGEATKRFLLVGLLLTALPVCAQEMPKSQKVSKPPVLNFHVVPDFLKIPSDMIMAEAAGLAINSKGHIFILNRGNHPLLEFTTEGEFGKLGRLAG